jgi:hypothetical protein
MATGNPYNKINPLDFLFRKVGEYRGRALFVLRQNDHSAFDMCVFRRHLVDLLMDGLLGDFRFKNMGNDYSLELDAGWDEVVLRNNFRVV